MTAQNNAPIIIKRKKVIQGGGHHGGAWKVAYADFVTAMMAFFMLMWLLGATTEKQRKGIADYFNPTIPIVRASGGGNGSFGGDSVFSENTLAQNGTGAGQSRATAERQASGNMGLDASDTDVVAEGQAQRELEEVQRRLLAAGGEAMFTELIRRHIVTRVSDEGLVVELFDLENAPIFEPGTAIPTPLLGQILPGIIQVFDLVINDVAIQSHASAQPVVRRDTLLWDITAARADTVRRLMQDTGFSAARLQRITGYADRRPVTVDPMAVRNNRVEIILLRDRL